MHLRPHVITVKKTSVRCPRVVPRAHVRAMQEQQRLEEQRVQEQMEQARIERQLAFETQMEARKQQLEARRKLAEQHAAELRQKLIEQGVLSPKKD